MPAEPPPSLEDLARAAVLAWNKWCLKGRVRDPEFDDLALAVVRIEHYLSEMPAPPRALDYMLPCRTQVELRFACALLSIDAYPGGDEMPAIIRDARRLARLLLDGAAAR